MRHPAIKDTHDNFITWCVSTASTRTWTTTEEHRFWAPWSFLMRLSTTERWGAFAVKDSSMHTVCLQYCNEFLSHSAKFTNGKPTTTHGYAHNWGHFGTLPHHLPQDNCLFSKHSRGVALHQKVLKKGGFSQIWPEVWNNSHCKITQQWPATTCSTALFTILQTLKSESLSSDPYHSFPDTQSTLRRSLPCRHKINRQQGSERRPGQTGNYSLMSYGSVYESRNPVKAESTQTEGHIVFSNHIYGI